MNNAFEKWEKLLGNARVLDNEASQAVYGRCTTGTSRKLAGALKPTKQEDIPSIVQIAANHKISLYPISTGHNWGYGTALPAVDDCVILDLSELNRIIDFDSELGVVTVEPGVTQDQLAEFLEQKNHSFMTPVNGAGPTTSLVGNALERGYGITPTTDRFASVMAIQAVLADGSLYQTALTNLGGEQLDRIFKWGIGPYLDGIFSQGSFGIVTQMTLALIRRPESIQSFLFGLSHSDQLGELIPRIHEILSRLPGITGGINLMNAHRVLAMAIKYPHEQVAPEDTIPPDLLKKLCKNNLIQPWTGFGTLYGSNKIVKAAQQEVKNILQPLASRLVFVNYKQTLKLSRLANWVPGQLGRGWRNKLNLLQSSLQLVAGKPNQTALPLCYWLKNEIREPGTVLDPARDGCGLIWYAPLVPMKTEQVKRFVDMVYSIMTQHRIEPLITLTSLSERCFDSTVPILFDLGSEASQKNAKACYWQLLKTGQQYGFLPYRVNIETMPWLSEGEAVYWQTVRRIKKALDPEMVIAPGRYI